MASYPRSFILEDHSYFHVTWKCHNDDWLLREDWAKELYYQLLLKYKSRYQIEIYSYCLMDNHPHLTGKLTSLTLFSDFFRVVNSKFAKAYNKKMKRKGQVVMDRFKSPRIQTDANLLKVMFYVDLNPKRARKVNHPQKNTWSSYAYYAHGKTDALITPAPVYLQLAQTQKERQLIYQKMVEEILKNDWKEKRPYSSTPFIGNPQWVKNRSQKLKEQQLLKTFEWKAKYNQKFSPQNEKIKNLV